MQEKWTKQDDDRYEELNAKWIKDLATPAELSELKGMVMRGHRIGIFTITGNGPNSALYAVKSKVLNFPVIQTHWE